ncbi:MAG: hypothetical protein ACYDEE_08725 [Ignavibacteriaceae bacterium]
MEYGICKTNLKYLDTKNNPPWRINGNTIAGKPQWKMEDGSWKT